MNEFGKRYIGLDVHKHYLIALGVDEELHVVLPARRLAYSGAQSGRSICGPGEGRTEPEKVAYEVGKKHRPGRQTAVQFARERMDVLGLGQELTSVPWGSKKPIPLPPSVLGKKESDVPNTK
jgi:hypothetical protein